MNWERLLPVIRSLLPSRSSWKAVLLSVIAATTFWFFNSLNQEYTATIYYPLQFDFTQEDYVVMESLPDEVQINVSGVGWSILRKTFGFNILPVSLPLEHPADINKIVGSVLLPTISEQLDELRVNYVITDTLDINIDRKRSKKVAIQVDSATISLDENYRITSSLLTKPDSVTIVGPESIITQLPDRLPMAIEEKNIDEDFDEFVSFKIRGYSQPLLQVVPPEINVQFSVNEFTTLSGDIPVKKINFPENATLIDSTCTVTITMQKDKIENLLLDSILVEVNYDNVIMDDSTILPILIKYPPSISSITTDTTRLKLGYE